MKIRAQPDILEIGGEELETILRDAVREKYGRELDQIIWVNVVDRRDLAKLETSKLVHLNATLKPAV